MPNESLPSTIPVERFLAAMSDVHPMNVAAVVRSATTDPAWLEARSIVEQRVGGSAAVRNAADAVGGRVREIATAAAAADTGSRDERPTAGEIEGVVLGAAHALVARTLLEQSGDGSTFATVYRPFEGLIPLNLLSAGGDAERERLVGGEGTA